MNCFKKVLEFLRRRERYDLSALKPADGGAEHVNDEPDDDKQELTKADDEQRTDPAGAVAHGADLVVDALLIGIDQALIRSGAGRGDTEQGINRRAEGGAERDDRVNAGVGGIVGHDVIYRAERYAAQIR